MKKKNIQEEQKIKEEQKKAASGEQSAPAAQEQGASQSANTTANNEQEIKLESGNPSSAKEANVIEEYKKKIESYEKERQELIEKIKLSQAELINYRKRKDEETASILKYANQDLIKEIILIVDNFESAIKLASKSENPEVAKYLTGFQMMYTNLLATLNKFGVEVIDRAGEVFDSNLEQALVAENDPTKEDEIVLEVLQKGYKLKDRVIRPASVKINQK